MPEMTFGKYKGEDIRDVPYADLSLILERFKRDKAQYTEEQQRRKFQPSVQTTESQKLLTFGKFRGKPVNAIPDDYLEWLLSRNDSQIPDLEAEIERRHLVAQTPMSLVEKMVNEGWKTLSKKAHPDAGGSESEQRNVNAAKAFLMEKLRELGVIK